MRENSGITVSIGFLGNIYFDTRTYNLFHSLKAAGYKVIFNGFDWLTPDFQPVLSSEIKVAKLVKGRFSLGFYIRFAVILLLNLIKERADIYFASDIYSLPFCTIAAKLRKAKVFYDSREVYTGISGLRDKKIAKKVIEAVEKWHIKRVDLVITTGELDSRYLEELYGIDNTVVLRNVPLWRDDLTPVNYSGRFSIPKEGKILLYQGRIAVGRGIETYLEVLQRSPEFFLVLVGGGEYQDEYERMAVRLGVRKRVFFVGKVSQGELLNYTAGADVGLCVIDNISLNNYYALPNKLFEYIMAGIPVIVSDMPQMRAVVERYDIGAVVPPGEADAVVKVLKEWEKTPYLFDNLKKNCRLAAKELNWETEFGKICGYFNIK